MIELGKALELRKAKYIKRTGSPGHYKYWYRLSSERMKTTEKEKVPKKKKVSKWKAGIQEYQRLGKELLKAGGRNEAGVVIDEDTGKKVTKIKVSDTVYGINVTEDFSKMNELYSKDSKRRFVTTHTHPHDFTFSTADIFMFLCEKSVGGKSTIVFGDGGSTYQLKLKEPDRSPTIKDKTEEEWEEKIEDSYLEAEFELEDEYFEDKRERVDAIIKKVASRLRLDYRSDIK